MGQMHALTALELEGARRREVLLGTRSTGHGSADGSSRSAARRDVASVAAAFAAVARTRFARG